MEYTDDEQATLDLDWFAVDGAGEIAHFASAGRPLPRSVSQSKENNTFVREFFRALAANRKTGEIDPGVTLFVTFESVENKSKYGSDFMTMCTRGLYSYDTTLPGADQLFFRVCSPQEPLKLDDLPIEVATIVRKTSFAGRFASSVVIKFDDIS